MKNFMKVALLTTLFSLTFQANASLVFYDWTPDQGDGGEGFFVLDTTGVSDDPANFQGAPLVDFFFQFVPTGPAYTLTDFASRTRRYNATDGEIVSFNINLIIELYKATSAGPQTLSTAIDFTRSGANCYSVSNPDPTSTFTVYGEGCVGADSRGEDFNYNGQWTLREPAVSVSSPQALGLIIFGLILLVFRKQSLS